MNSVACLMPCRGRIAQTIDVLPRLVKLAGMDADWIIVADADMELHDALYGNVPAGVTITQTILRHGYWRSLELAAQHTPAPLLANLANDLLPGRDWLKRAVEAYRNTFGTGDGLMGFNDGIHTVEHSSHFLISRGLLACYGGWPSHYDHNFGDTELCERAIADGVYAKASWATLYHNHWQNGAATDATYAISTATWDQDAQTFSERKARGWT